jgi:lycopene cyclase domain-containing protein
VAEYTLAAVAFLAVGLLAAGVAGVLRERAAWAGMAAFGLATVAADLVLTGIPIVTYGPEFASGIRLGPMPVEDLVYGLALYLVAIAAWGRRPATAGAPAVGGSPVPVATPGDRG